VENKFEELATDKILFSKFEQYMCERNVVNLYLCLEEINKFKNSDANVQKLVHRAQQINEKYFTPSLDGSIPILISDLTVLGEITNKSPTTGLFDEIERVLNSDLRRIYQDFCWNIKSIIGNVHEHFDLMITDEDQRMDFYQKCKTNCTDLHPVLCFYWDVHEFRKISSAETMLYISANIVNQYFKSGEVSIIAEYLDVRIIEGIQKLANEGICSRIMFEMAAEYARRPLVMLFVDLLVSGKKNGNSLKRWWGFFIKRKREVVEKCIVGRCTIIWKT